MELIEILDKNELNIVLFVVAFLVTIFLTKFILTYYKKYKLEKALGKSGMHDIDYMDGFLFEEYLSVLFKKLGYKPQVTKRVGDYGADLILKGKKKIVVQAKRYRGKVGLKAVQEVYSAKAFYNCDEAWVVTNSIYTNQAKNLAKACNVKLIDREGLQKMILKANPEEKPREFHGR